MGHGLHSYVSLPEGNWWSRWTQICHTRVANGKRSVPWRPKRQQRPGSKPKPGYGDDAGCPIDFLKKKTSLWDLPIAGIMAVATLCLLGLFCSVTATHRIYLERRHGLGKIRSFGQFVKALPDPWPMQWTWKVNLRNGCLRHLLLLQYPSNSQPLILAPGFGAGPTCETRFGLLYVYIYIFFFGPQTSDRLMILIISCSLKQPLVIKRSQ